MTDLIALGNRIAARRYDLGLRQEDVADAIGCSRSQVANIERGAIDVPLSRLTAIAKALNTSVGVLIGEVQFAEYHGVRTRP